MSPGLGSFPQFYVGLFLKDGLTPRMGEPRRCRRLQGQAPENGGLGDQRSEGASSQLESAEKVTRNGEPETGDEQRSSRGWTTAGRRTPRLAASEEPRSGRRHRSPTPEDMMGEGSPQPHEMHVPRRPRRGASVGVDPRESELGVRTRSRGLGSGSRPCYKERSRSSSPTDSQEDVFGLDSFMRPRMSGGSDRGAARRTGGVAPGRGPPLPSSPPPRPSGICR